MNVALSNLSCSWLPTMGESIDTNLSWEEASLGDGWDVRFGSVLGGDAIVWLSEGVEYWTVILEITHWGNIQE